MGPTTIALQVACVVLGAIFTWLAFALSTKVLFGGLVIGSMMFMCAALLGADHTSNPEASFPRRRIFKILAILSSLPVLCLGFYQIVQFVSQGLLGDALSTGLTLISMIAVLIALAFDSNPTVQRILRRVGVVVPKAQVK